MVELEDPIGATAGYLGTVALDQDSLDRALASGATIALAGYPQVRQHVLSLATECGPLRLPVTTELFLHRCPAMWGDSGAPILLLEDGKATVVGLMSAFYSAGGGEPVGVAVSISAFNVRDKDGGTPLHWAATYSTPDDIVAFLSVGADVEARDMNGRAPLHWAAESGTPDNIAALVSAGADVNARDRNVWTPLHWAARYGTPDVISALLKAGASGSVKDKDGKTPFALAGGNNKVKGTDAYRALDDAQHK